MAERPPSTTSAQALIDALDLRAHPEGGFYRETWRHLAADGGRGAGTAIYFLLRATDQNRWHRIDAAELWHHYDGAPLELWIFAERRLVCHVLGRDVAHGQRPQHVVPAGAWQRARTTGEFTLAGCTVSPAFEFERFELAPEGWEPGRP